MLGIFANSLFTATGRQGPQPPSERRWTPPHPSWRDDRPRLMAAARRD